jgi:hypothetical protein
MRTAARLLVCAALAAGTSLPAPATILVSYAQAGEPSVATLYDDFGDICVNWSFLGREGATLYLLGHPVSPCPGTQYVNLPPLAEGRYRLVASFEDGQIWDEASFIVGNFSGEFLTPLIDLSPTAPAPSDPIAVVVSSLQFSFGGSSLVFLREPVVHGDHVVFDGDVLYCPFTCPPGSPIGYQGHRFVVPPLSPGLKFVTLQVGTQVFFERSFMVAPPAQTLFLDGGRFEIGLVWRDHSGEGHDAAAGALTDLSGKFWFFHPENVEVMVKILDGRPVNGAFWLFAASMTDLGYTLTVTDHDLASCEPTGPCPRTRTYEGAPGASHNVIDTKLFSP